LEFQVSLLKGSFCDVFTTSIEHVLTFVRFLCGCNTSYSCCKKLIFRSQFVFWVLNRLLLFWLLWLLPESSLVLLLLCCILLWFCLQSLSSLLALLSSLCLQTWDCLLILLILLSLFLLILFLFWLPFWRHWIKHPWRLTCLFTFNKRSNVYYFTLVLVKAT